MAVDKSKRQHSLPDRRLAKSFRFSASDLATNRAGFITRAQLWSIPLALRGVFAGLDERLSFLGRRQVAATICGRARLSYEQQQIQSIYHSDFVEVYKLSINNFEFRISPKQHRVLGDGLVYRLYYNPDTKQILSLERPVNGC